MPAWIPAAIGAAGSIIGGIAGASGSSGGDQGRRDYEADRAYSFAVNQMKIRSADAERAGLHPLAALGISPGSYSIPNIASDNSQARKAQAMERMGQNVGSSISKALMQRGLEYEKAKIEHLEAQTEAVKLQVEASKYDMMSRNAAKYQITYPETGNESLNALNSQGQQPAAASMTQMTPSQINYSDKRGQQAGLNPFTLKAITPDGEAVLVPTQAFTEPLSEMPIEKVKHMMREMRNHWKAQAGRNSQWLQKHRPKHPDPNKEFYYNRKTGSWWEYPKGWKKSIYVDNKSKPYKPKPKRHKVFKGQLYKSH